MYGPCFLRCNSHAIVIFIYLWVLFHTVLPLFLGLRKQLRLVYLSMFFKRSSFPYFDDIVKHVLNSFNVFLFLRLLSSVRRVSDHFLNLNGQAIELTSGSLKVLLLSNYLDIVVTVANAELWLSLIVTGCGIGQKFLLLSSNSHHAPLAIIMIDSHRLLLLLVCYLQWGLPEQVFKAIFICISLLLLLLLLMTCRNVFLGIAIAEFITIALLKLLLIVIATSLFEVTLGSNLGFNHCLSRII